MKIGKTIKTKLNGKMRREKVWEQIELDRRAYEKRLKWEEERWERLVPVADLFKF